MHAFTRKELLVVLGVVSVLALIAYVCLGFSQGVTKAQRCRTNLRQLALAIKLTDRDSYNDYRLARSTNIGGTQEYTKGAEAYQHFRALTNELEHGRLLICPSDVRKPALDTKLVANENLSYFLNLDADPSKPNAFLSGDRLLGGNPQRIDGLLIPGRSGDFQWNRSLHPGLSKQPEGNAALSDGSVSQLTSSELTKQFTNEHNAKNRFLFPE